MRTNNGMLYDGVEEALVGPIIGSHERPYLGRDGSGAPRYQLSS